MGSPQPGNAPQRGPNQNVHKNRPRCFECFRVHAKCTRQEGSDSCQKCQVEGKECRPRVPPNKSQSHKRAREGTPSDHTNSPQAWPGCNVHLEDSAGHPSSESAWEQSHRTSPVYEIAADCQIKHFLLQVLLLRVQQDYKRGFDKINGSQMPNDDMKEFMQDGRDLSNDLDEIVRQSVLLRSCSFRAHDIRTSSDARPQPINRTTTDDSREEMCTQALLPCVAQVLPQTTSHHSKSSWHHRAMKQQARPRFADYQKAEKVLDFFVKRELGHCRIQGRWRKWFPAIHIAYLNRDHDAVRSLWMQDPCQRKSTDILGRKLAHLIVEGDDWQDLGHLLLEDHRAISQAGVDLRGMCLWSLAALSGNEEVFLWLRLRGVCERKDRHLLNFALIGRSQEIIQQILHYPPMVSPPYNLHLQKAIELGQAGLAQCFLNYTNGLQFDTMNYEALYLAQTAQRKDTEGMDAVAALLWNMSLETVTPQHAQQDLAQAQASIHGHQPPFVMNPYTNPAWPVHTQGSPTGVGRSLPANVFPGVGNVLSYNQHFSDNPPTPMPFVPMQQISPFTTQTMFQNSRRTQQAGGPSRPIQPYDTGSRWIQ